MSPVLAAFFCEAIASSSADNVKESPGFVMEIPEKESDVLPIVQDIAADSIIRGTYVYERDKELTGAMPAKSSNAFGQWQGPGQVFYKVVIGALAPRHFLDSADVGTVTLNPHHIAARQVRIIARIRDRRNSRGNHVQTLYDDDRGWGRFCICGRAGAGPG